MRILWKLAIRLQQEPSTVTLEFVMYRVLSIFVLSALLSAQTFAISISSVKMSDTADAAGYYKVTVQGSGFGAAPNIALFDDFNNQTSGAPIVLNKSALIGKWINSTSYSAVPNIVDYDKGKAFQIYAGASSNGPLVAQIETVFSPKVSNLFISYSVVVPQGKFFAGSSVDYKFPDASSWKFTWITDTPSGLHSPTLYNICTPTHSGYGSFMLSGNSVSYGWLSLADSWSWHTKNYISYGTLPDPLQPQEKPGTILFEMTGKANAPLIYKKTDTPIFPATNTTSFDRVKFPGWFGNGDTANFDAYYDDIYVATGENAFARVEISNAAALNKSTINLTMPINSWSDTTIELRMHKEHLSNSSNNLFVRVHDRSDMTATSALICDKCPKPPTAL